jgi:hypothetical protein
MTLNEIRYNPATSTFLSVVGLSLKSFCTQKWCVSIEPTGRYTQYKQVKVVYYYIEKEQMTIGKLKSWSLSYNVVVSLPFE